MFARSMVVAFFALLTVTLARRSLNAHEFSNILPRNGKGSAVTNPVGLSWYDPVLTIGNPGRANVTDYTCYSGPATNFPNISAWMNFDAMWDLQKKYALIPVGDTLREIRDIRNAIVKISKEARVDARLILAVIIIESTGNVNVSCTYSYGGIHNCGLMQSYNATDTSYNPSQPQKSITQMIRDGTQGTAAGPGLVQNFNDAPDTLKNTGGNVYKVLRAYNSGQVNASDLSDGQGANPAYVSNAANYLQGWNGYGAGPTTCSFEPSSPIIPPPSECVSSAYVTPPAPTPSGTTPDCCDYYVVVPGDYCYLIETDFNISFAQLTSWNKDLNAGCTNLYAGDAYCVDSNDPVATSSTSTSTTATPTSSVPATCVSSAYVPPPTSTFAGSTPDCCEWYIVQPGDYCYLIETEYDITFAEFVQWNTEIDSACDNLDVGYAYCVDGNVATSTSSTATVTSTAISTSSPSTAAAPTVTAKKP